MLVTQVITDRNVGGAGIVLKNLAGVLSREMDFEIILPKGSSLKNRLIGTGARVVELPIKGDVTFDIGDTKVFYDYFKDRYTDILHTHACLSARIAASHLGIRALVSTRHCAKSDTKSERNPIKSLMYSSYTVATVSTADCATQNLIDEGVDEKSIVKILNGVPKTERITNYRKEVLKRGLFIPSHGKIIGCCARLEKVKGQDVLLRAAARLIRKNRHLYFVLVGSGSQRRALGELSNALGISSNVRFTGYTENAYEYQNLFDINVSASRGTETSCLANSECMSLGIPTVASDFGGNSEVIKNEKNGLVFASEDFYALADAISSLIYDKNRYDRLCSGAYECWEKELSLDTMADKYRRFYLDFDKQYYDFKRRGKRLLQSNKY